LPAPRWTPTLDDYLSLAAEVLETSVERLRRFPRLHLADSALSAPFASFGGDDAYPSLLDQAAVLLVHLVQNHPLPDGNKRAGFLLTARFLDANGRCWKSEDVAQDAGTVERVAAGQASVADVRRWIEARTDARE
jgi:death-on-curing protein